MEKREWPISQRGAAPRYHALGRTLMLYICSKRQPGHHYTYRASTHVQQLSDNQQRRLETETTHEREERLQQLSDNQQRKLDTETTALRSRSPHNA